MMERQQYSAVVQQQPGAPGQMNWMPAPQAPIGCPPGLEYLLAVDQILIHQEEVFTGCMRNNKYKICNTMSQQVYFAQEEIGCCTKLYCGPGRQFEMKISDNMQREVIHLSRPVRMQICCCPSCCLQEIEIQSPPGTVIGYVEQKQTCCKQKLEVQDAQRQPIMMINGPCCPWSPWNCGADVVFSVTSADERGEIGKIFKESTDAANFGIRFPLDLDIKFKAILMGAVFLVDFMFFEQGK